MTLHICPEEERGQWIAELDLDPMMKAARFGRVKNTLCMGFGAFLLAGEVLFLVVDDGGGVVLVAAAVVAVPITK